MAGIYRPRLPERTVLYRVLFHHFDKFLAEYEACFEREYGFFRPVVKEVVERYLDCGNPKCGFARIGCPDCREKRLPHPFAPFLQPFGMTRRAESPGAAGEVGEKFRTTVWTADLGEPAARVAAIQISFDRLFDDRTEEAVLALESVLIFRDELFEMMEENLAESRLLRMTRTIDCRHVGNEESRNAPFDAISCS